ncbi:MAG: hypothetical protein IT383_23020 [Deltaproteobacteria bacterium]|nr:hypothetical protein [Deltaproteobacteria bacterium]
MSASNDVASWVNRPILGALLMLTGCASNDCGTGVVKDQAFYEELLYDAALSYEIVHGTAHIAAICEHDVELDCPDGRIADPVTIEIDADWMPEQARLDRSLPIFASEAYDSEMNIPSYITMARFVGLEFNPGANVVCGDAPAVDGWRNFVWSYVKDSQLEIYGIDHEGLHQAIERGIADSGGEVARQGGVHQLDCGGPPDA